MKYVSTRGEAPAVGFSEAVVRGLAPDGGLYVPERFPGFSADALAGIEGLAEAFAAFLSPFVGDDPLAEHLGEICRGAFDFPLPLTELNDDPGKSPTTPGSPRRGTGDGGRGTGDGGRAMTPVNPGSATGDTRVLELFHGPTAAFKDFGARFLAECFQRRPEISDDAPLTVLVATSGDTGGAVASAFHLKHGTRVGILFPRDGVSPRQERQLTCWGDNVRSFAVRGTFDDCQRVVKQAFRDRDWSASANLTSANSINVGRLLPQAAYYAVTATRHVARYGCAPCFVIPSGNMGNAVGAFWAKHAGFPIDRIALATNANRTVPDWFDSGDWRPRASLATLANAMDVGDPSNMERLFLLHPNRDALLAISSSLAVDDETIREVIAEGPQRYGRVWCPHTATAIRFRERLSAGPWVVVATAHPAKFDEIVEPLIGKTVELPPALAELMARPVSVREIDADLDALRGGMG